MFINLGEGSGPQRNHHRVNITKQDGVHRTSILMLRNIWISLTLSQAFIQFLRSDKKIMNHLLIRNYYL
jgi:hypothetical protein